MILLVVKFGSPKVICRYDKFKNYGKLHNLVPRTLSSLSGSGDETLGTWLGVTLILSALFFSLWNIILFHPLELPLTSVIIFLILLYILLTVFNSSI